MRLSLLVLSTVILLGGCSGGAWRPGYFITSEGEMLSNTDDNFRAITLGTIVRELNSQLGGHWRVEATIAELPIYTGSDDSRDSGWMWTKATTRITLIGDGTAGSPLTDEQITKMVRDYMSSKVEHAHRNLSVTTTRTVDATLFVNKGVKTDNSNEAVVAGTSTMPMPMPTPTAARGYTVQAGDTWADLSQAFYGSPQHWRLIADANQGGDLTVGRELTIPPKP